MKTYTFITILSYFLTVFIGIVTCFISDSKFVPVWLIQLSLVVVVNFLVWAAVSIYRIIYDL